jgi:hypothetical protein
MMEDVNDVLMWLPQITPLIDGDEDDDDNSVIYHLRRF